MKLHPKISIVIPVYNVAPYLRKCVDSVLSQDYESYEIILVDDGSTDESGAICDEYASASFASLHHPIIPIKVIHKPNGGLSDARNAGLKVATGEYVVFLDSDDYWSPNVLGALMAQVEQEQLDVLRFNYQYIKINEEGQYEVHIPNKARHLYADQSNVITGATYLNERMDFECLAVQFVIKREIVCEFVPGIHFEDAEWMPRMMLGAKRVNGTSLMVYNYLIRSNSISQSQGQAAKIIKNAEGRMRAIRTITDLIPQHTDVAWLSNIRSDLAYDVLTYTSVLSRSVREDFIMQLRALKVFPLIDLKINKKYSQRIFIINRLGPQVYCIIMKCRMAYKQLRRT